MEFQIRQGIWHGFTSFSLENDVLQVCVVPDLGAKIVSLLDKTRHHEWLVGPMRNVQRTSYGDVFTDQDMSGWDEMMPTITSCNWQGHALPDHGEVWSVPWQSEVLKDGLRCHVHGTAMDYCFTRTITLADDCMALAYTLANQGDSEINWLWAAHPQFAANENTRIVLPAKVNTLINVIEDDPDWGKCGTNVSWPLSITANGRTADLSQIQSVDKQSCRKFYLPPELPFSWAALVDQTQNCALIISADPAQVPYLGIWVDEGVYNSAAVAALEPSTGFYDGIDTALQHSLCPTLAAGQSISWNVKVKLTDSTFFTQSDHNGGN